MILRRKKSTFNEFRTVTVPDLGKTREEVDWLQLSSVSVPQWYGRSTPDR